MQASVSCNMGNCVVTLEHLPGLPLFPGGEEGSLLSAQVGREGRTPDFPGALE